MEEGIFIVIEGADGSGKGTQFRLLHERLKAVGYDVEVFDFPRYEEPSSHFVRKYLNGEYGKAESITPYAASLFFALDRYEAAPIIRKALKQDKIVLANRFVGSNMAHQGGKFTNTGEQRGFFIWEDGLEFELLGIPRPTKNIFLRVPAEVSYELIARKEKRSYTDKTRDEHEGNLERLKNSVATYDTLCQLFPKDFKAIECAPNGKLMSIADINNKIWTEIKPILPPRPPHAARDVVVQLFNMQKEHAVAKKDITQAKPTKDQINITPIVTDKNDKLVINIKKVSQLAARRVQAVTGVECEVLSTQWPADDGSYYFYTPANVPKNILSTYKNTLDKLTGLHKQIQEGLEKNKTEKVTNQLSELAPLAALTSIKISGGDESILNLINQLRSSQFDEVKWLAEQIRVAANQIRPEVFSTVMAKDVLDKSGDTLSLIANENLRQVGNPVSEMLSLQEVFPKNEFSLLTDALFQYSNSSRSEITEALDSWSYDQKKEALSAALRSEGSPVLDEARYRWDIVMQARIFYMIKESLNLSELQVQPHSSKYGYDVPQEIELAAVDEIYIECYRQSLKLFNLLKNEGQTHLAAYGVLSGNKNRWQFTTSARNIKKALLKSNPKEVSEILNLMNEKIAERHALISEFISRPQTEPKPTETEKVKSNKKPSLIKKPILQRRRRSRRPKK
jgi:dTMP kinase